jgi:hypothetical protein
MTSRAFAMQQKGRDLLASMVLMEATQLLAECGVLCC